MLKPTKPFKDTVTNYPKEPCLRIGKQVPKNAVNLAYYYNPIATDAEKVLTAEAPRNTIDHRVEDAYRYLFNQSKDDDSLFPGSISFEDEDGYRGQLGRMYVQWYPEAHIETKSVQGTHNIIVIDKAEVPKMYEYTDDAGYSGNLYLDAAEYEVTKTRDVSTTTHIEREVFTHELNYREIFGKYLDPKAIDAWLIPPTESKSLWPQTIIIDEVKCNASNGNTAIIDFVNNTPNVYDEACGALVFDNIEYEQVYKNSATNGSIESININSKFKTNDYEISYDVATAEAEARALMKSKYEAVYDPTTDKYSYTEIQEWLSMARERCENQESVFFDKIELAINNNKDIVIFINSFNMVVDDETSGTSKYRFEATYGYKIASRGADASYQYNIVVNYKGKLSKTIVQKKEVPAEYKATCNYVGLVRKVWYDYDGVAYYRGSITKGNSVGNINPSDDDEILMFSDDEGYLRRPIKVTDEEGNVSIDNFYDIEADYIYLTDVFKDGKACFYKYQLKKDIYDYRGPDDNGFYSGNAIKVCTANSKGIPSEYAYNVKLSVAETEVVDDISNDFHIVSKEVPKRYNAELYTSFVSSSTDTFNVTYNAFNDSDEDNIDIDSGIIEDIYNYPFMYRGIDFFMEKQENLTRINKVRLATPRVIEDTRRYISFKYTITAERKEDGKKFTTSERTASILNRDFVVPFEYEKFDGRGMIISPESDGILLSPFDLVLYDQASLKIEPIVKPHDTGFIFYATITKINDIYRGAVNIKCNADGSGYITAETTIDTGFFDERFGSYTKKLCIDNPYLVENGKIYPGIKVKCIDSRHIKVNAPRNDGLLESWYPMIQFGHYSQVMDQYGAHTRVFYSMPEYDTQHYSSVYGVPYVDIEKEKVTVLNSHMVKTSCFPLFVKNVSNTIDEDTYFYRDKMYKIFKQSITWKDAQAFCKSLGGNLAMPKTQELGDFIINIATQYSLNGLWLGATDEETEGVWKWVDGTTMTYNNWANGEPNNSGGNEHYLETYTKSNSGKWNDLANNNTGSISGFICEFDLINTVKLYKEIDGELFNIKIKDISFSDGIIITEDTISENDNIICDYTYVEENYVYRGFWRNTNDFARIDLNPNMYHTYSDMNYIPSVTKPSKNLFNKVIYFFMRPSLIVEGIEVVDTDVAIDSSDENLLARLYEESDLLMFLTNNPDVTVLTGADKESKWSNIKGTIQGITNDSCLYMFKTLKTYMYYEHTVTMKSTDSDNDCLVVVISVVKNGTSFDTLSLVCRLNSAETHCSLPNVTQFALVYNYYQPSQKIIGVDTTFTTTGGWSSFPNGMTVKIIKDIDGSVKLYRTNMNGGTDGSFDTSKKSPVIQSSLQEIYELTGTDFTDGAVGYGNVSQSGATFKGINVGIYSENRTTHTEYQYSNPIVKNEDTLYHQIDNPQPESDQDIYIGSVYIRQNTSLHSTVLVDARTRGGGVIKEMSDSLRRELEPDSDFYLDIGFCDGEPYQENGVIIVRLDNSLLKEFGGRFTHEDIDAKVRRWLGFGVYPIIEYVDTYSEQDMPQHNLVVEDSYTNVINETPQIYLECVDV